MLKCLSILNEILESNHNYLFFFCKTQKTSNKNWLRVVFLESSYNIRKITLHHQCIIITF